ncbi:MAG: TIM barrel protein [Planctomycetota bacterium]|nr:TIM barrel protein [Planctomycetota bacterium]
MLKFSANLGFLYPELPLLEEIAAAAAAGFKGVEVMFPYPEPPEKVAEALSARSLTLALFNALPGNWAAGERGLAVLPGRDQDFRASLDKAVEYAVALGCPRVNVMAGVKNFDEPREKTLDRLVDRLGQAADVFAKHNLNALLEHINPYDMPGYFVSTPKEAIAVLERVKRPNAKLQYDIYHAQRTSGELTAFLRDHFSQIEHIQIADNPGRNQPGTGEINYPFIFCELERLGYQGWIGLEYKPTPSAAGSFAWMPGRR